MKISRASELATGQCWHGKAFASQAFYSQAVNPSCCSVPRGTSTAARQRPSCSSFCPSCSQPVCCLLPQAESLLCPMTLGSLLVFALNLNPWISTCSAAVGWALQPPLGTHLCLSEQPLCLMELVSSLCPSWFGSGVPCSAQTVKLPPGSVRYIPLLLVS